MGNEDTTVIEFESIPIENIHVYNQYKLNLSNKIDQMNEIEVMKDINNIVICMICNNIYHHYHLNIKHQNYMNKNNHKSQLQLQLQLGEQLKIKLDLVFMFVYNWGLESNSNQILNKNLIIESIPLTIEKMKKQMYLKKLIQLPPDFEEMVTNYVVNHWDNIQLIGKMDIESWILPSFISFPKLIKKVISNE